MASNSDEPKLMSCQWFSHCAHHLRVENSGSHSRRNHGLTPNSQVQEAEKSTVQAPLHFKSRDGPSARLGNVGTQRLQGLTAAQKPATGSQGELRSMDFQLTHGRWPCMQWPKLCGPLPAVLPTQIKPISIRVSGTNYNHQITSLFCFSGFLHS